MERYLLITIHFLSNAGRLLQSLLRDKLGSFLQGKPIRFRRNRSLEKKIGLVTVLILYNDSTTHCSTISLDAFRLSYHITFDEAPSFAK